MNRLQTVTAVIPRIGVEEVLLAQWLDSLQE